MKYTIKDFSNQFPDERLAWSFCIVSGINNWVSENSKVVAQEELNKLV